MPDAHVTSAAPLKAHTANPAAGLDDSGVTVQAGQVWDINNEAALPHDDGEQPQLRCAPRNDEENP